MSYDPRISLIQDTLTLLQEESCLLASFDDAQYFRMLAKQKSIPTIPREALAKIAPAQRPVEKFVPKETAPPQKIESPPEDPEETPPAPPPPSASKPAEKWRSDTQLPTLPLNFASLKTLFQRTFPATAIIDEIPNDTSAKKIAGRWKTKNQIAPISILHFGEPPKQKALLAEIVKAIDVYFGPARLINAEAIEKEKQWETFLSSNELKLIIACDYTLWQLADLMRNYKEVPSEQTKTLGNIPLLLLPDLSLYLKDPLLKRSLWKAIERAVATR